MANCIETNEERFDFSQRGFVRGQLIDADGNMAAFVEDGGQHKVTLQVAKCTTRRDMTWFIKSFIWPAITDQERLRICRLQLRGVSDESDGFQSHEDEPLLQEQ